MKPFENLEFVTSGLVGAHAQRITRESIAHIRIMMTTKVVEKAHRSSQKVDEKEKESQTVAIQIERALLSSSAALAEVNTIKEIARKVSRQAKVKAEASHLEVKVAKVREEASHSHLAGHKNASIGTKGNAHEVLIASSIIPLLTAETGLRKGAIKIHASSGTRHPRKDQRCFIRHSRKQSLSQKRSRKQNQRQVEHQAKRNCARQVRLRTKQTPSPHQLKSSAEMTNRMLRTSAVVKHGHALH